MYALKKYRLSIHKQAFIGIRSQKMRTVSTFLLISLFFGTAMPRALEFRFDPDGKYLNCLRHPELQLKKIQAKQIGANFQS